ncbi:hypothetical protein BY996DRAFT_6502628 [Phakopsora pachyrhizi]|nr:hypothetical protein BY996DRAFT_6502628 [Phakopsora pachyrhizi]
MSIRALCKEHHATEVLGNHVQPSSFPPPSQSSSAKYHEHQGSLKRGQTSQPSSFSVPYQHQPTQVLGHYSQLPSFSVPHQQQPTQDLIPCTYVTRPTSPLQKNIGPVTLNSSYLQVSSAKNIPPKVSEFEFSFESPQAGNHCADMSQGTS